MGFTYNAVPNKFNPRKGQTYRFIGVPGSKNGNISLLIGRRVWSGGPVDQARLAKNNVFETLAEAKAVREKIVTALKDAQRPAYRAYRY